MAIAFVSSVTKAAAGETPSGIDTSGANLIAGFVAHYSGSAATFSDSKGNTPYIGLTSQAGTSDANAKARLFYFVSPTVGTGHTFTCNDGTPAFGAMSFSGAAASPYDQESGVGGGFDQSLQPGSLTPPENDCVVLCGAANVGVSNTIDSGFTSFAVDYSASVNMGMGMGYLIQTSAAAINPTASWSGAYSCAVAMATFKPATGGGNGAGPLVHNQPLKSMIGGRLVA